MKQVLQNVKSGDLTLETVPPPALQNGGVRVRTAASLISAGTEKMLMDLASKSLVGKAQARPDLVRQVLNKIKKEGVLNTYRNVQSKLEKPMPLGYSAAGVVESVGRGVTGVHVGDRVALAGAGYANHAEVNYVPRNLIAAVPDNVPFEDAAYVTVASIALQGVRLAKPELGDYVVVIGLGLIGLITVQLLQANGCRVLGVDLDPEKVDLALGLGMDAGVASSSDSVDDAVDLFTEGRGADHTLITASTKGNGPIVQAGEITRRKGQVVVVGAIGMDVPRDIYYKKELEIKVSMSYGPGRYDASYEEGGIDYPYDYVRWTEQRNMKAVLALMSSGRLDVSSLTTHRFEIDSAVDAYDLIRSGSESYVGILLEYDVDREQEQVVTVRSRNRHEPKDTLGVGFVGAGNYAALHLIPHVSGDKAVQLRGLVTATGASAQQKAEKFGFSYCTTELEPLLNDESVDSVWIATRHGTHAEIAIAALDAGKHVFVEKPMVVNEDQLRRLQDAYARACSDQPVGFMVGLNRRFAPMVQELRESVGEIRPKQMIYRVNSGHIPVDSWLHEPEQGGGMLIGEMVHFVDLMQFLSDARPLSVYATALAVGRDDVSDRDNLSITISFDDGSVGTLCYNTVGDSSAPKERLEVYGGGAVAVLDDFRRLEFTKSGKSRTSKSMNQDKGQAKQVENTLSAFKGQGTAPIPFDELVAGMQVVFAAERSLSTGSVISLD